MCISKATEPNKIILYTDAGCIKGKGGFAFLLYYPNNMKQILAYGTLKTSDSLLLELTAIKKALEYVVNNGLADNHIELCCDVLHVINFFNDSNHQEYLVSKHNKRYKKFIKNNADLLKEISELISTLSNIKFVKVKSKKNKYNNITHSYASLARSISPPNHFNLYEIVKVS